MGVFGGGGGGGDSEGGRQQQNNSTEKHEQASPGPHLRLCHVLGFGANATTMPFIVNYKEENNDNRATW